MQNSQNYVLLATRNWKPRIFANKNVKIASQQSPLVCRQAGGFTVASWKFQHRRYFCRKRKLLQSSLLRRTVKQSVASRYPFGNSRTINVSLGMDAGGFTAAPCKMPWSNQLLHNSFLEIPKPSIFYTENLQMAAQQPKWLRWSNQWIHNCSLAIPAISIFQCECVQIA